MSDEIKELAEEEFLELTKRLSKSADTLEKIREQTKERREIYSSIEQFTYDTLSKASTILERFIDFDSFGEPETYGDKSTRYFFRATIDLIETVTRKIHEEMLDWKRRKKGRG